MFYVILVGGENYSCNEHWSGVIFGMYTIAIGISLFTEMRDHRLNAIVEIVTRAVVGVFLYCWAKTSEIDFTSRTLLVAIVVINAVVNVLMSSSAQVLSSSLTSTDEPEYVSFALLVFIAAFAIALQVVLGGKFYQMDIREPTRGALLLHSAFFGTYCYFAFLGAALSDATVLHHTGKDDRSSPPTSPQNIACDDDSVRTSNLGGRTSPSIISLSGDSGKLPHVFPSGITIPEPGGTKPDE